MLSSIRKLIAQKSVSSDWTICPKCTLVGKVCCFYCKPVLRLAVAIVSERLVKEVRLVTRRSGGHTWGNGSESSLRGILGIEGG